MKIVFFGASRFVLPVIDVLRKNYDLVLVVTTEKAQTEAVPSYCKHNNIPYISIQQCNNETIEQLQSTHAPLAVLAYFGLMLPKKLLDIFPKGIINIHPSLLPTYRGPTPGQTALRNGDTKTGVTIIRLDEKIDHGPIVAQAEEPIKPNDTAETLYERLFTKGANMLSFVIRNREQNVIVKEKQQDHTKATFTKQLSRQSGYIDINNPPTPEKLDRMIRAYYPWPGVWTRQIINGTSSIIKFLPNKQIQIEGKKPVSVKDFINGYPEVKEILLRLLKS